MVEQGPDHGFDARMLGARDLAEVDALEHEVAQRRHRRRRRLALDDRAGRLRMLDEVVDERVDPRRAAVAEHGDRLTRQLAFAQHAGAQRVVDVVVEVGEAVGDAYDCTLERRGRGGAPGMADDAVADLLGQVETAAIAFEHVDDAQRLLPVVEVAAEALAQAAVEHVLADVAERRVAEIVAESDRLDEVLVEAQRARDGARDAGDLERVREARAVVVALRRDENLRLVLEAAEGLAVHDPVAVALEGCAQRAVVLGALAHRWVGARRRRRQQLLLALAPVRREARRDDGVRTRGSVRHQRPAPPAARAGRRRRFA